jgi:nitroimidazol reductase NimA-like FMN-containing flavoprotein (pyridoxamine 5'-phosphate oxidase superfamily)
MTSTAHTTPREERAVSPSATATTELLELDRSECLRLLAGNNFGRLAVTISDRTPVIRPVNYVFDESSQSVVFRTALGSKFGALIRAKNAVFEIDGTDEADQTGWSVVVSGVAEAIVREGEIERLTATSLEPWAPGQRHFWMRIRAFTVSGRRIVIS